MKAAAFTYHAAPTLAATCAELADRTDNAKVMGGGQSMGPMLNLRLTRPDAIYDLSKLAELRTVTTQQDRVRIGAAVTHAQIEDGEFPALRGGMLQSVARGIAYRAIRNRGTIGGSLAHADPAADWVVALTAIGAQIELASKAGTRIVPMTEFMLGAYTTALTEGELICAVHVPSQPDTARWGYHKLCRKTGEFAEASCAAYFDPSTRFARIALGALDGAPALLRGLASDIAAQGPAALTPQAVLAAVTQATPAKDAIDRKLCCAAVTRCIEQLFN
ncbi:FAD binding domain-containing protein [Cupriavidus basilensis]|uniref:FAD binding domain-containing protein n=1 Tax=Cupriavidus basilensis TaxID=68895 RepID=UPI0020A65B87|nr:FAD binding domain-containing protein [Cupriavidus basilensis]MCP3018557.1 FAD binding domain-containing protein [Cupriavidus basilensis]MDR3379214.1 FAD binding domain-containing protein [Cupriavidus basilensis]